MIAKHFRFHGYGSLKYVYTKGTMVRSKSMSLKYVSNPRRAESRLAVVVSKKVTKKSPARNRIRRRVYEAVREKWALLKAPHDLVISVFDEHVETMPSAELKQTVHTLLEQAKLYK